MSTLRRWGQRYVITVSVPPHRKKTWQQPRWRRQAEKQTMKQTNWSCILSLSVWTRCVNSYRFVIYLCLYLLEAPVAWVRAPRVLAHSQNFTGTNVNHRFLWKWINPRCLQNAESRFKRPVAALKVYLESSDTLSAIWMTIVSPSKNKRDFLTCFPPAASSLSNSRQRWRRWLADWRYLDRKQVKRRLWQAAGAYVFIQMFRRVVKDSQNVIRAINDLLRFSNVVGYCSVTETEGNRVALHQGPRLKHFYKSLLISTTFMTNYSSTTCFSPPWWD